MSKSVQVGTNPIYLAGGSSVPVIVSVSTTATIGHGVDQVSIDGTTGPFTVTIEPVASLSADITLVRTDAPIPIPPAWPASTLVILGYQILDPNGHVQEVTTAGTTDATIPASWSTSGGTTAETGGSAVVWTDQGVFVPSPVITIASTTSTLNGAASVALDNYALTSFTVTKP